MSFILKKNKILYIVSSLGKSGPTNQLSYIVNNLDSSYFDCNILTLSAEPSSSMLDQFINNGINVETLNLSRISSFLIGERKLKNYIKKIQPSLVHTQGIRADLLMSKIYSIPWVSTSRNYPLEDYPSKFGFLKGRLMCFQHLKALRRCTNLVSCSYSISHQLKKQKIKSRVIQNGVPVKHVQQKIKNSAESLRMITVGSLIPRKNMKFIMDISRYFDFIGISYQLLVLGDGPEFSELNNIKGKGVKFLGNVQNVYSYLDDSDIFISSSLSEGLPNTVLEALSRGLNVILSDIDPHLEITKILPDSFFLHFKNNQDPVEVAQLITSYISVFKGCDFALIIDFAKNNFSDYKMSCNYQKYYKEILNVE